MLNLDTSPNINFRNILNSSREGLIKIRNGNNKNGIVFIHGFQASSINTWGNKDYVFWPFEMAKDLNCNGYCFNYDNPSFKGISRAALPFDAVSERLLFDLAKERLDRIVFITHSFGGLVVKKTLLKAIDGDPAHRNVAERTFSVSMLSCPNYGHWMAAINTAIWGNFSASNALLLKRNNRNIIQLHNDFINKKQVLPNLQIQNIAELGRRYILFKVDEHSAFAIRGEEQRSRGNHSTMCKNLSNGDQEYKWIQSFSQRRLASHDKLSLV